MITPYEIAGDSASFLCRKQLPRADPSVQCETDLDRCLRKWRNAELSAMVDEAEALRESATDTNAAIDQLQAKLLNIRKLAFDVSGSASVLK